MSTLLNVVRAGALLLMLASPLYALGEQASLPLMPYPQAIERAEGHWQFRSEPTLKLISPDDAQVSAALDRFRERFARQTHRSLSLVTEGDQYPTLVIELTPTSNKMENAETITLDILRQDREAYRLTVNNDGINLRAPSYQGINHGLETLLQLFGHYPDGTALDNISLPHLVIEDAPRFLWRGLMLDSVRHFFSVETIKRQLDAMAAAKLNIFHWHLTDDQGWRLESRHYPRLQEKASDGHYYTREEVRDIVEYAMARGIQVVPEIDMPGHSSAIGVAYPELMATPGPYAPEDRWGVHTPLLNPANEEVYVFAEKILAEVSELFPFEYVHIGGDEVNPRDWLANENIVAFMSEQGLETPEDLHTYFNQRLADILAKHSRRMIGWDEILHRNLPKGSAVQSWRGPDSVGEIANQGHPAILSTGFYLDMPQYTAYHYRNPIFPQAPQVDAQPSDNEYWESWSFALPRKRGAAITGRFTLIRNAVGDWRGVIDFSGRSRQDLANVKQVGDITYFEVDTWAGPVLGRVERQGNQLSGDMVFGNAPYPATGERIGGSELAGTRVPEPIPTPRICAENQHYVLGGEAALWSEIVDERHIDLRLWPRAFAVAERLWSSASLTNETFMHRRLLTVSDWAEQSLELQHKRQAETLRKHRIPASQRDRARKLSEALEPAHYYHRHHEKSVYETYSRRDPLDRLVDTLPVESHPSKTLARQLAHWRDPAQRAAARTTLQAWQTNARALIEQVSEEGDPGALKPQAQRVITTTSWGLTLLDLLEQGVPLKPELLEVARRQLRAAQHIEAEIVIPAAYPVERLLDGNYKIEDRP